MGTSALGPRVLLKRLREVMAEPVTAQKRLDKIVQIIAANMVAEVCSIYVMRPGNILELTHSADVAKVSVVGIGMRSHAGVAAKMFRSLADKGINIQAITTSEIKVSVLIDEAYTELAVRALHTAYGLDAKAS